LAFFVFNRAELNTDNSTNELFPNRGSGSNGHQMLERLKELNRGDREFQQSGLVER
jgi:hypothetical protein